MAQLCLVVQTGPYTYQNLDTAYGLARAALAKGHGVSLFLYIDGVVAANKNIDAPGERNIAAMLQELAAAGVRIASCGACSKFRGITDEMYIDGAEMGSLVDMADMIQEADVLINFGF
ncbi:DsrE/DsrF/TusD sulfur relay family protein [Neomoorella thermoacetica]|uniref:Protein YchN n=3 Tax=Neomoorella thermoacetica TaxID=1525 RepID=A0A1D7X7F7_NEOTH|nr:DsrE family protein [Moorella thermoacetica]MDN5326763.1 hypothetical protein [Moorella sp. (in: firmicutes)]AKX93182.1 putative sulfurtransferase DsrE [Moorella thermoacetica]AKX95824.1 putative sulfurtransferase DsrE [Moorella thermoacetica]AOQ22846.1 Putative sulfurtransferase DsrE [Moorella thermoacetica]APC07513.1 putative sulfurtransferase DsrE [Moorella thermoacetica]